MSQPQHRQKETSAFEKGLLGIKQKIDKTLEMMKKDPNYTPKYGDLDEFSTKAIELVKKHHPLVSPEQKALLAALIDLTEVPVMAPTMQRVAFEIALRDASNNILKSLTEL